jgi:hypothetical protein
MKESAGVDSQDQIVLPGYNFCVKDILNVVLKAC